MCGIVGYLGPMNPKDVILQGLKRLEYRGYDSAGVSILNGAQFKRVRAEGKLKNLETRLANEKFEGHLGIGHTRWATHGVPSERNAHPHEVRGVSLVHNGIIENYLEIRETLKKRGAQITSDTDSELVAHLIAEAVEKEKDLLKAVRAVLPQLRGAFSILAIWNQQPDRLIAFKDGPPLVVGISDHQSFVVSDVQAALAYTNRFIYLDDREIAEVAQGRVNFFDLSGKSIDKKVVEIKWNNEQTEKLGFSHFMLKEIYEQPQAIANSMNPHLDLAENQVNLQRVGFSAKSLSELDQVDLVQDLKATRDLFSQIDRILIVACGTSFYSGLYGKYLIERFAQLPVEVDVASEFRYRQPYLSKKTLMITISQSGETADTLAALRLAKKSGVKVLSICNVRNSAIDREADGHLYLNSGPEIGVASTKAFVSTMTVLHCLSLEIAKARGHLKEADEKQMVQALLNVPAQLEVVLSYDKYFEEAAATLKQHKGFLFMGRGANYAIALEGALKMKELAYLHAEGYAAGEMKHGPLALIDKNMAIVVVAPKDEWHEKTLSNLEEAKARGGQIISVGNAEDDRLRSLSQRFLGIPEAHWTTSPILAVVPLQLMAFHVANSLGHDVDQPRNLAKSVTVE